MDQEFDFTKFELKFEQDNKLQTICSFLHKINTDVNTPLIPDDETETGLKTLLKALNIAKPPEQNLFQFQLTGKSIQEVEAECATNNVQFPDRIRQVCNRMYYNSNYTADGPPNWQEMSRPEAADYIQELSELFYLDTDNKVVDWSLSIAALQTLATNRRYTTEMMTACLLRLVNKFHSDQTSLLREKTADEIAQFLIKMDANRDKATFYKLKLQQLVRLPGEDLATVLTKAQALIDEIYPAAEISNQPFREACSKTAIVSFLPDSLSIPILKKIKLASSKCEPLPLEKIHI